MAYTKTNWVNDQQPDIDADNLNKMEQGIYDAQFPDGGTEGQLLARTANGRAWVDAPNSAVWGLIQGTLSDQTDLANALENTGKVDTVNGIQPDVYKNVQVDIELTKAEYDALPSSKESDDVNYWIKDGTDIPAASVISASGVQYDNTQSGMSATNVQGAVDEVKSVLNNITIHEQAVNLTFASGDATSNLDNNVLVVGAYSLGTAYYIQHYFNNNDRKWHFNMFYFSSTSAVRVVNDGNYAIVVQYIALA